MKFIDIHSHVIPLWDDGSQSWEMSIDMLRQAEEDGIVELICTPHVLADNDMGREDELLALFEELKVRAKKAGITIKLHIGAELYIQPKLDLNRTISTLAQNQRYFLVEFSMTIIPDFVAQRFFELVMQNRIPIIAHPERYGAIIENPKMAYDYVERGALMQVNAGSLLGVFGNKIQKVSYKLLEANLVHFVGSDGHDLQRRPVQLGRAYQLVCKHWGQERASKLFYENQIKMMAAEEIKIDDPILLTSEERQSFRDRIAGFWRQR